MSDQDTIFGGKPNVGDGSPTPSSDDALGTLLASITNEQGEQKYSDVPKALEALASSQTYIPELHTKMDAKDATIAELREKLTKTEGVEEMLDKLRATHQTPEAIPAQGLDAGEAAKLFETLLGKNEQKRARDANIGTVTKTLGETFGDNAEQTFYAKGKELGLSPDDLNNLAGTSPAAVLALFGKTATDVSVSSGSQVLDVSPQEPETLGRNTGKSVLMGSTARDVREEYDKVKGFVSELHEKGLSVEDLTDPKKFRQHFG